MSHQTCRFCHTILKDTFVDLGMAPPSNAYRKIGQLNDMEPFYPLHAYVCSHCFLVQLEEFESPAQIFSEYAYFSSVSSSWLEHASRYVDMMTSRFGVDRGWQVMEIASNDGYLLQYFQEKRVPVLGIEPAANVAEVAQKKGIPTITRFFGMETAKELVGQGQKADLLLGNNVLAHVPDINDFVAGMKMVLGQKGIITMEFPHLLQLMAGNQFDTIYHEHFSYLSLLTVRQIFSAHGLTIFDVEVLATHGGSLRIFARHDSHDDRPVTERVAWLLKEEEEEGLDHLSTYELFAPRVHATKRALLSFLIQAKAESKAIVAYGAAAKGNTLLNYCGIRADFLDYVVDRSSHKQSLYLPGTHLPIFAPEKIKETRPDYLLILPWNIKDEVMTEMAHVREWGGRFVVPIPTIEVFS